MSQTNSNKKDTITASQAAVIVINNILGAGILTLPRTTAEAVKTPDVWISIIISGLVIMLAGLVVVTLCRRFPGKTLYQFSGEIIGKGLSKILGIVVIMYFTTVSAFEIRVLAEVTELYVLEGTPKWAIIIIFMWVGFYLTVGGINPMARLFEIILPITLFIFLIAIFLSKEIFEIDNLRPVLGSGIMPVIKGLKSTLLAFIGYESMFVIMAFIDKPKKGAKAVLVGILIPQLLYIITLVMVIGGLSINGVVTKTWPTLDLMRSFELEGVIFERFESLLLIIWIMQIFSTFTITYYAASLGCAQVLGTKRMVPFYLALLPIIYIAALFPKNVSDTFAMGDLAGNSSIYLFMLLPLLLLVVAKFRKKGVKPK